MNSERIHMVLHTLFTCTSRDVQKSASAIKMHTTSHALSFEFKLNMVSHVNQ